ncbi:component of IIS longevity pathway SMK-1-domain-containing protein [Epithele typhae]|uniref:component of IIS longevity pathway SMK-1-domain-containing protein n=1 Tax=Epithele typhae TaxID=378194 RepID=UPI002008283E|nr:component of IIS longevity pathway SMK-1-domain-containing protein [Epithele typhae]KAH9939250.1 component of IIS longevity pathway SMK-1-domain-containing protein [Epithele typhae]
MSSVDAASEPAPALALSSSPADQPPAPSDAPLLPEPPSTAETHTPTPEVETNAPSTSAAEGGSAPVLVGDSSSSQGEVLVSSTVGEAMEGADAEQVAGGIDESQQWTDDDSHELKRVKVYELMGSRWVDQGTAFCFGDFQDNEALLIARAEEDFNRIILTTTIRATDVYQRQQETLIVWTEPDGVDYALSFQDPEGCAEVWQFIEEVQRHMNSGEDMALTSSPLIGPEGPDQSITTANIIRSGRLPQPQMGIIGEIDTAIKTLARTAVVKERVCEYIQNEEYIKALIDVFQQAEDLESLPDLHALFGCMQTILLLNEHSLYEHILDDEIFVGVVGMLEYDPEFPNYKANYREFLRDTSHYHQPIPIRDETIQRKIHHTYRLQFLKDVVLARAIDDSTFNVLNSSIIFNQIDIITHVQNDQAFLREIAGMFMDDDLLALLGLPTKHSAEASKEPSSEPDKMDVDSGVKQNGAPNGHTEDSSTSDNALPAEELTRRREVVFLVQQLCMMGKNVQLPARMALFRALVDRGIVFAVQWGLSQPESDEQGRQMIATSGEVMMALLDHDLNGVRGHVLKQLGTMEREKANGRDVRNKETVLMLMCKVLVRSRDLAVQSLVGEALKLLLELMTGDGMDGPNIGLKMLQQRAKDDPGIEKFLDYFYKFCIDILFKPFQEIPEAKDVSEPTFVLSPEKTNLFLWLCDLISNFTQQHSFRSHFYVLSSNIAPRIATLLRSKDKHLRLAAFRFFRTCLRLKNGNVCKYLIKSDVFKPILDLTTRECRRDNLVSSTCLEFFDFMRRENVKDVISHCMTKHGELVKSLAESPLVGSRFKDFIARWEMNIEPPPLEKMDKPATPQRWTQPRLLDTAEEDYFNADDDEEVNTSTPPRGMHNGRLRKRPRGSAIPVRAGPKPFNALSRGTPPLGSLVDYGDGDDAAADGENVMPTPGRASPIPGGFVPPSYNAIPASESGGGPPASPRIAHRMVLKPPLSLSDDSDILEELSKGNPSLIPKISGLGDGALGAKRRRDVDDDDELLERLAKAKRPTPSPSPSPSPVSASAGAPRSDGLGPVPPDAPEELLKLGLGANRKTIKIKVSPKSAAAAAAGGAKGGSPGASSPGSKEGDNG